jgi:hypothetical protein
MQDKPACKWTTTKSVEYLSRCSVTNRSVAAVACLSSCLSCSTPALTVATTHPPRLYRTPSGSGKRNLGGFFFFMTTSADERC